VTASAQDAPRGRKKGGWYPLLRSGDRAIKNTKGISGFRPPETAPMAPFARLARALRRPIVNLTSKELPPRLMARIVTIETASYPPLSAPSNQFQCRCLMPRPRQRVCLQQGLKLDLSKLSRQGLVRPGASVGPYFIRWFNTYWGEEIASGLITASMEGVYEGSLRIQIGSLDQRIILVPRPRHFGGPMVLCLPGNEPLRIGALDASWLKSLLQPAVVGPASCLR
jgi:hypothetical protein